jgi:hypothetical protein
MKLSLISIRLSLAVGAGLALSAFSSHAQDVLATGTLTYVPGAGNVYDYTLTLQNTGSEAIQSLWFGWILPPIAGTTAFNVLNPSNPANSVGWGNTLDGSSIMYAGTAGTAIASGGTAIFTFGSTSTPAQFQAGMAGPSVAYGVDASQFAIENTTLHSFEFDPTLVTTPEPSTFSLLAIGALGFSSTLRRKIHSQ